MRDGIVFARQGLPSVALVTSEFTAQGDFVARSAGMPDIPRVELPHPVAGATDDDMAAIAVAAVEGVVAAWRGGEAG